MVAEIKDRPAYVTFEVRSIEDREASIEQGHTAYKDVIFAIITPQGSKDRIERIAEEWISQNVQHVREGRMPEEWHKAYSIRFEAFREGRELPPEGTPILTWPAIGPSQQKAILDADIRTVEDLANANESTLSRIGMGGRMLKQRAIVWIESADNIGKASAKLEAYEETIRTLQANAKTTEETNLALVEEVKNLKAAVEAMKKKAA